MKTPKTFVSETLQEILSLRTPFVTHNRLMFIPHQGMARNDRYNLMNWRSDNALTLAQYILSHDLQKDKILTIAVSANDNLDTLNNYVATTYPGRKVEFVKFFGQYLHFGTLAFLSSSDRMQPCFHLDYLSVAPIQPKKISNVCGPRIFSDAI